MDKQTLEYIKYRAGTDETGSIKPEPCQHPPARLHSWHVGDTLCVCCNECGAVLAGGAE